MQSACNHVPLADGALHVVAPQAPIQLVRLAKGILDDDLIKLETDPFHIGYVWRHSGAVSEHLGERAAPLAQRPTDSAVSGVGDGATGRAGAVSGALRVEDGIEHAAEDATPARGIPVCEGGTRGNQRQSTAISGHQRPSAAISGVRDRRLDGTDAHEPYVDLTIVPMTARIIGDAGSESVDELPAPATPTAPAFRATPHANEQRRGRREE